MITIQTDFEGGREIESCHLELGESRSFGRGGVGSKVDIALAPDDRAVSRLAGTVTAGDGYWYADNYSNSRAYVVDHADRTLGYVQVAPGAVHVPIPFEISRIRLPGTERDHTFLVMAPQPLGLGGPSLEGEEESTQSPYRLDTRTTYFRALVALCEPRLRDSASREIPVVREVAERLRISPAAVNGNLQYLIEEKFKIDHRRRQGVAWKQHALVDKAIQLGLVHNDHLRLLDVEEPR